ncbi:MAG TPA: hypothetical protein VIU29_05810 [Candidatus Deferrimicrobiaceae bacterium]
MSDRTEEKNVLNVECPCCGSRLVIDAQKGAVIESHEPVNPRKEASLSDARKLINEESSRIHEKYRQIVEADKGRGVTMEKKFKEFMEKAKDEPAPKPVRDIDLD